MNYLPYLVAAWLFSVGLYGVATSRHLVHLIVCLSVVQSAGYILLLSVGYRLPPAIAPVFDSSNPPGTRAVDPVVQAMTLTDIVVSATVMALLLAIAIRVQRRKGPLDPTALRPLQH